MIAIGDSEIPSGSGEVTGEINLPFHSNLFVNQLSAKDFRNPNLPLLPTDQAMLERHGEADPILK